MALALSTAILRLRVELRTRVDAWKRAGERIGVVPTMGALHEGHLALVRAALTQADRVVVTLFVNPRQFNSAEDLAAYPRTERADAAILSPLGADVLYVPDVDQIYPPGFATTVHVAGLGDDLCGAFRPGHFDGVATVVPKLLLQTGADLAFFGEKDFQQITIVRRLVADLDIPCEIVPVPTVRETDGLALSSRNVRLAPADRAAASAMFSALSHAAAALRTGVLAEPAIAAARAEIEAAGFERVEYVELRRASDLAPLDALRAPARLLAAAWLGGVRLIDNIPVDPA